ncbi:MAG: hypothetical protein HY898_15635 [Deltaproteobacteria bacterium]|nr:hypothetical protein [Deltaproteobacteria bacterium]
MGASGNTARAWIAFVAWSVVVGCGSDGPGGTPTPSIGGSAGASGAAAGTGGTSGAAGLAGASGLGGAAGSAAGAAGADSGTPACFPKTPGTQCDQDRSEPCGSSDLQKIRYVCEDTLQQACLPNYDVWTPIVCGGSAPPCTCSKAQCLPGEAAKAVSGEFCACLNLCTMQEKDATCGATGERKCIPIDDADGNQVFICGGT